MKILFVTAALPYPPTSGGALRAYGMIEGLLANGHQVALLSFVGVPEQAKSAAIPPAVHVVVVPDTVLEPRHRLSTLLFTRQADIATRFYSPTFRDTLLETLSHTDYDCVQFEGIEIACYIPDVQRAYPNLPIVFDTFNAEAELQRTIARVDSALPSRWPAGVYSHIQANRLERYEGDLCRRADAVIAVSDEDAALLKHYQPDKPVHVVPSGIFVRDYAQAQPPVTLPPNALVFTGKMDYRPNVDAVLWFAEEVLPHLPNAHFVIVGQQPHTRIQPLAKHPRITLTGRVESVTPYLYAADVYVAPLRMGSGTRLKLLEAMATRCAIVATPIAASGLNESARAAMHSADGAQAMAQAIQTLLDNPAQRRVLGQKAQQAVQAHYDWPVLFPRLLAVYREVQRG